MAQRLKKGDIVMVISGKDRGRKGKIINFTVKGVVVEKMNIAKKHTRPSKNFQGGIIEKPMPIDPSRLMPVCPKCGEASRVRFAIIDDEKLRKCASCDEILDKVK